MATLATLHARINKLNIFLDIDGVLCPPSMVVRDGGAYCHFTRFETIMREFPEWKLVISSGLRERLNLNQLRNKFSDDIAARIVGVTPVVGMSISQCRQREIERYLHNADQELLPWIALDDMADQFVSGLSNLVLCDMDTGLVDCIGAELRAKLTAYESALHSIAQPHSSAGSHSSPCESGFCIFMWPCQLITFLLTIFYFKLNCHSQLTALTVMLTKLQ